MAFFDFLKTPSPRKEPPRRNGHPPDGNGRRERPYRENGQAAAPPRHPPRREEPRRDYGDDEEDESPLVEPREEPRRNHREREHRIEREERPRPRTHAERHDRDPDEQEDRPIRRKPRMPGSKAVLYAREHLMGLLGREPEAVSGLSPGSNGWKVRLEAVEMPRVPSSTDVMATYEVEVDEEGELVGYHRVSRYYRNQTDSDQ